MRFTLPQPKRRRPKATATSRPRVSRSSSSGAGGPVPTSTEYVGTRRRRSGSSKGGGSIFANTKRSAPITRRMVLAVLICACLGLITASYRGGVAIHSAQVVVLEIVAPIERGMSRAWDPIASAWNWTGDLVNATSENDDLRQENERLRAEQVVLDDQISEVQNLRDRVSMEDNSSYPTNYRRVNGRVIGRVAGAVDRSMIINLGSSDGIRRNDPVLVTAGLIGRVTSVGPNVARVSLILDSAQSVTASITGSEGGWGILQAVSTVGTPVLQLKYVKVSAEVSRFDQVVTAGWTNSTGNLESIFPRGIPIGYVSSVGNQPADLEKTVQVTPFANFERIEDIIVLVPKGQRQTYKAPPSDNTIIGNDTTDRVDPAVRVPTTLGASKPPIRKPATTPASVRSKRAKTSTGGATG